MATLQSTGIGSGLDVNGLVTQLVAAERAAKQGQITKQQTQVATKITAMGSLKGALGAFQTALAGLKTTEVFSSRSAKSGDEKIFTASAGVNATPSSYGITVEQLAKAQQIASADPFPSSTAPIGTGLLMLAVGEKSFTVNVTEEASSLENIRDAINNASDNVGVTAAIVRAADGPHLVLTSSKTGADNVIKVTTSEGDGGLAALTYDAAGGNTANFVERKPAHDSIINIAGFPHHSDSNTVTTAIDGVTITLLKEDPGTEVSLDVKLDRDNAASRINNFVAAYNQLASTMGGLQSYDAATKKAGALIGDAMIRGIEGDIRGQLVNRVDTGGVYDTLASIGVTTKKDGTLEVNSAKLKAALERDFAGVAKLFGSEDGLAARLDAVVAPRLDDDGEISARNKILDQRTKQLTEEQVRLNSRMEIIQQRYLKQFSTLDTLLGQMQQTSSYLTQQLASLPKIGG